MSKFASAMQIKLMPIKYRGKEVFKPLNTGVIDERAMRIRIPIHPIFLTNDNSSSRKISKENLGRRKAGRTLPRA